MANDLNAQGLVSEFTRYGINVDYDYRTQVVVFTRFARDEEERAKLQLIRTWGERSEWQVVVSREYAVSLYSRGELLGFVLGLMGADR